VQNTDTVKNTITIDLYNTSAQKVHTITRDVEMSAGVFVDMGDVAEVGATFNGSVVATAVRTGTTNPGSIVASSMELAIGGVTTSAFEGVAAGGQTFYMPSALCAAFGADTAYAVQNTSLTTATNVTVTYSNNKVHTKNIGPGAKASFLGCDAPGAVTGFSGSAIITSDTTPVIAIGKAFGSGLSTAFLGVANGAEKVAMPYVRWGSDADFDGARNYQRTFLTIQNVGNAEIPAGQIKVDYVGPDGTVQATHTINTAVAAGAKTNSNAGAAGLAEFGINGGAFGGGAIVTGPAGSELAVVARVSSRNMTPGGSGFFSEDYNGMPTP
jgi:hypothetical protein